MREQDVMGSCGIGKAAGGRRATHVTGTEYLPSTFIIPSGPEPTQKLDNPAAMQAAARVMGKNIPKLVRAAEGKGRRLSSDEAQRLIEEILYAQKLQNRGF